MNRRALFRFAVAAPIVAAAGRLGFLRSPGGTLGRLLGIAPAALIADDIPVPALEPLVLQYRIVPSGSIRVTGNRFEGCWAEPARAEADDLLWLPWGTPAVWASP